MQKFEINAEATTSDDVKIPITITVEYPDNQGLTAWQILKQATENAFEQVIQELIRKGDLSLLAAMRERGMVLDESEDGFGDDD